MAYQVPETEPIQIVKNATLKWNKVLSDFPASSSTLTYFFKHSTAANNFSIAASASGDTHVVNVAAASVTYTAGTYRWFGRVVSGGETYYPDYLTGELQVINDPASAATARVLTQAQTMLAAIQAVLQGTATADVQSYTIKDRAITRYSLKELREWEAYYQKIVNQEKRKEDIAKGIKPKDRILISLKDA